MADRSFQFDDANSSKGSSGPETIDPRDVLKTAIDAQNSADGKSTANGTEQPKRKRGRPKGSKTKRTSAEKATLTDSLATGIHILHYALARGFQAPEFELDETEAKAIAKSVDEFSEAFDVKPSPKVQASINLAACLTGVYVPKVALYNIRKAKENAPRAEEGPQQPQPQPQTQPRARQNGRASDTAAPDLKVVGKDELAPSQIYGFSPAGDEGFG